MRIQTLSLALSGLILGLSVACGGSSSSPAAAIAPPSAGTGLSYTNPSSTGWRLEKDASSTSTRIVLNLVGPSGLMTRGVGFNLQAPATVNFGTFPNGLGIGDTGVYQLLSAGSVDPSEPVALVGAQKAGNILTAGIFQKDRAQSAQNSGVALCQVAIVFNATKGLTAGTQLPLQVLKAKVVPEDIGSVTDPVSLLDKKMRMVDITVAVGTLSVQ